MSNYTFRVELWANHNRRNADKLVLWLLNGGQIVDFKAQPDTDADPSAVYSTTLSNGFKAALRRITPETAFDLRASNTVLVPSGKRRKEQVYSVFDAVILGSDLSIHYGLPVSFGDARPIILFGFGSERVVKHVKLGSNLAVNAAKFTSDGTPERQILANKGGRYAYDLHALAIAR